MLLAQYVGYKAPEEIKPVLDDGEEPAEELDDEAMAALAEVFGLPVRIKGE